MLSIAKFSASDPPTLFARYTSDKRLLSEVMSFSDFISLWPLLLQVQSGR
jgi:hypothetical protein